MADDLTMMRLPRDVLVKVLRSAGSRAMTDELLQSHIDDGFTTNDDGTIDLFDYVAWLIGEPLANPQPRTPPTTGFDVKSVNPTELGGWLTLYNHLGVEIPRSRMVKMFQSYHFRFAAKDNDRNIDFLRFAAFVVTHRPPKAKGVSANSYLEHKAEMAKRNKEASAIGRDIGELPAVEDEERKKSCEYDFKLFCETYMPETFNLGWSDDHLRCIDKIEKTVLEGGQFALALPRGFGKALALDTPLPTPSGWTTMGDVKVGDWLFDENGQPCKVLLKSPVFIGHKCFNVKFNDGSEIICDADHLWQVEDIWRGHNPYVETTEWLSTRYKIGNRGHHESRFRIPYAKPLDCSPQELPIEPYALGVWLGDGDCGDAGITLFNEDVDEIVHSALLRHGKDFISVRSEDAKHNTWNCLLTPSRGRIVRKDVSGQVMLKELGLLNDKHIPRQYLRSSIRDRIDLMQGIMDTDGYCDDNGTCEICIKFPKFADDFAELLASLGIKFTVGDKYVELNGKTLGPYKRFYINAYAEQEVFSLKRKLDKMKHMPAKKFVKKLGSWSHTPPEIRTIVSIEEVPSVPTQCVMVDSPNHLYLCGKGMIPTHNTAMCEAAAIWSMMYGHKEFIVVVGSSEGAAMEIQDSIKIEVETNERLMADFPEVCFPIVALEGIANRCAGQTYKGVRTRITWSSTALDGLVLPTIAGSKASGIIVRVAGITGRIRGMKHKRADGRTVRPQLVIIDDPQTRESARSLEQNKLRIKILNGDILGLAGPKKKITAVMPCTVIEAGDMADTILDRDKHPEWNGEKTKLLYRMPDNAEMWDEYAEIRAECLRENHDIHLATEFYEAHREEMDKGAVVAWPERFDPDEISAVQNAMNLLFRDAAAFASEYQNEPLHDDVSEESIMTADAIAAKLNGIDKGVVPLECTKLTMFIDIQKKCLFYTVCAWSDDFNGAVIDYGTFPEQRSRRFTLDTANPTLQELFPHASIESQIYSALSRLCKDKMAKVYVREDGAEMQVERAAIDANWGESTDVVYQFCRQNDFAPRIVPAHGHYVGASSKPMTEDRKKPGERVGLNWYMPSVIGKRAVRHIVFDTNFWKSFIHARLGVSMGGKGCLSLYGRQPLAHELYSEHLTAEYRVKTQGRGRVVDEWKLRPDRSDNHWLDCTAGCAMLASAIGSSLPEQFGVAKPKEPVKLSDLQESRKHETYVHEVPAATPTERKKTRIRLSDIQRRR